MPSFLSVAALSLLTGAQALLITQTNYITQYEYQEIDVFVNGQGQPYKTVTTTALPEDTTAGATLAATTSVQVVVSSAPDETSSTAPSASSTSSTVAPPAETTTSAYQAVSHSHAPNYQWIDPESTTTSSTPAPVTTTSSTPVPVTTTSSTPAPVTTTSSTPAPAPVTTTSSSSAPAPVTTTSPVPAPPAPTTTSVAPAPAQTSSSGSGSGSGSQFSGDATYYDVGLGACGVTNSDSDLIAALNHDQWDQFGTMSNGNPVCGKKATLHYQGKSVTVTVQDKCPGCNYGDLDLSPAAFQQLADEGAGRIKVTWSWD